MCGESVEQLRTAAREAFAPLLDAEVRPAMLFVKGSRTLSSFRISGWRPEATAAWYGEPNDLNTAGAQPPPPPF